MPRGIQVDKVEVGMGRHAYPPKRYVFSLYYMYIILLISTCCRISLSMKTHSSLGVFSCPLFFVHLETNGPHHTTPPSLKLRGRGFHCQHPACLSIFESGLFPTTPPFLARNARQRVCQ